MSNNESFDNLGAIAVVGMAGRFPGASRTEEFWRNLRDGVEAISFYTEAELMAEGIDDDLLHHPQYVRAGTFLPDIAMFDASFFGFTPVEAEITDPQHRIFLECAWEAIENAGYEAASSKHRIGVYAGAAASTYFLKIYEDPGLAAATGDFQIGIANNTDHLATRVSYKLNLKGPSFSVQTGCSASLVAVHVACQALLDYECDMALAGGISIGANAGKKSGYLYQEGAILSPDGHCRTFDAKARGTVAGNGVGIVVLRRLADAVADGDNILVVIKGSAINNDGALKAGYAAPSIEGQAEVITKAMALARVSPETITYVEAHGTATPLGDPIELKALTRSYQASTSRKGYCAVGSVKTNIGHLNTAAGVAGLIKTILALKHRMIPPTLHFEEPNPQIDFAASPFFVNTRLSEWPANGTPRRAGVSSFGIGGTNAHVIVEEAPPARATSPSRRWQALMLSARTPTALETATGNLHAYLEENAQANLADVAFTLQVGRRAFPYRRMALCRDMNEAISALEMDTDQRVVTASHTESEPSVAFMFPGQGTQYVNMGRELYETEPIFRRQVDACAEILKPNLGLDLREVLYPDHEGEATAAQRLGQTMLAQPALFTIEYGLAMMWMAWGVQPEAMIGHSIGEYVAACIAGVMTLEDALFLVATRARMMQQLPAGAMLVVPLPEEEAESLLGHGLSLAAINSPSNCVVSGPVEAVAECGRQFSARGIASSPLHTSHAFHSAMTEPLLPAFTAEVEKIELHPPRVPYISNLTGTWITAAQATDPQYWAEHLRRTVRFADGLAKMLKEPTRLLLEVGPSRTLSALTKQQPGRRPEQVIVNSLRHPQDSQSDVAVMVKALGALWLAGVKIDWAAFYQDEKRQRLPLPTYPFERKRFWVDNKNSAGVVEACSQPLDKRLDLDEWFHVPLWKQSVLPTRASLNTRSGQSGSWLLFVDEGQLCSEILKHLEEEGQSVITVHCGQQFIRLNEGAYKINPRRQDDYVRLFEALRHMGASPTRIVHLWNVCSDERGCSGIASYQASLERGFKSLLFLAQAIGQHVIVEPIHLDVVSSNMQRVMGDEPMCPDKAVLLGPCKVIPKEYPNITCRSIDLFTSPSKDEQTASLIEQLLAELRAEPTETVVAWRGGRRWVRAFESVRLERGDEHASRLREGGVYLITGLEEGLGLAVATHLAQTVRAKLILVASTAFPAPEAWDWWLETHGNNDRVSEQIRGVRSLKRGGTKLLFLNADVADQNQMQKVLAEARRHFDEINGAVHVAPVAASGLIQMKSPENLARAIAPAVEGTLALEEVLRGQPLDFLVLSSTIASSIAGFGQVDECAASSFLDAYAQCNTSNRSRLTVAIDWGPWRDGESQASCQIGMDRVAQSQQQLKEKFGITMPEGVEAFNRLLSASLPQAVVLAWDFQKVLEQAASLTTADLLDESERLDSAHPRPEMHTVYAAPRNAIEALMADTWQRIFRIERIGINDDFWDLGGNSLTAIQIITRAREVFQVEIPIRSLLAAPTVAGLVQEIAEHQLTPAEVAEIENLFSEINNMSLDEAHEQLARELRETTK
jgi:acyl transferase domain-containing protein/acyl carrier protein